MSVFQFVSDDDQVQLKVLDFLENNTTPVKIGILADRLNISEFVAKKAIKALINQTTNDDFVNQLFEISIEKTQVSYTRQSSFSPVKALRYHYAQNGEITAFIQSSFLENFDNQLNFSEAHYLSRTTFFNRRHELMTSFENINLNFSESLILTGDERAVRQYFYYFYLSTYGDFEQPYQDELASLLLDFANTIAAGIGTSLGPAEQIKLQLFLFVSLNRINHGHQLLPTVSAGPSKVLNELAAKFTEVFPDMSIERAYVEANGIVQFIETEIIDNIIATSVSGVQQSLEAILTAEFATQFNLTNTAVTKLFANSNLKIMRHYLHRLATVIFPETDLPSSENNAYLAENFTDYMLIARRFIAKLPEVLPDVHTDWAFFRESLTNDLIYTLIAAIPLDTVSKPINIAIDFTYGAAYNTVIQQEIAKFSQLNLHITHVLDETTDILISDLTPSAYPNSFKIQWTSPPTASDWEYLGNTIIQIKERGHRNESQ